MSSWLFIFPFIILALLALPLMLYPFRQSKRVVLFLVPLIIVALVLGYWRWGAWPLWQNYLAKEESKRKIEAVLQTIKSPSELIDRMKAHLLKSPKSARGWYLLGRLYKSQGQWIEAKEAFLTAYQYNPQDELIALNYAETLWQLNQQQIDGQIQRLLDAILKKNPKQPDTLALLAMNAFKHHHYQEAITHWQRLLQLAPPQSEEAKMIRQAIAKARISVSAD